MEADLNSGSSEVRVSESRRRNPQSQDLFGSTETVIGAGRSDSGRPKLPMRLMASLLYLKYRFNFNDEELVERRSGNIGGSITVVSDIIDTAVSIEAVKPKDLARVLVGSAMRAGICLKLTFAKEGKALFWRAGGYSHAKHFKRMRCALKRQRTILGVIMREVQCKLQALDFVPPQLKALSDLSMWLDRRALPHPAANQQEQALLLACART